MAFLGPILIILLFNTVVIVIVVKVIIKHTKKQTEHAEDDRSKYASVRRVLISTLGIMTTFGLTWLFGAFTILDASLAFQFLFAIFNSFQGFFLFLFYCVVSKEARDAWWPVFPCYKYLTKKNKSVPFSDKRPRVAGQTASTHMPSESLALHSTSNVQPHRESDTDIIANPNTTTA